MMHTKFAVYLSLLLSVAVSCGQSEQAPAYPEVKTAGKASNVMKGSDLSVHLSLDSLRSEPALIGLGPFENLRGEITVLNDTPYVSVVQNGVPVTYIDHEAKAPFFVYSSLHSVKRSTQTVQIQSLQDLQNLMTELQSRYRLSKAFPFVIEGDFEHVDIHIIMRDTGEEKHSHKAHKKAKQKFEYNRISGTLAGFYSTRHEGVFTHKGQYIHVHFIDEERTVTGHLDDLTLEGEVSVTLPDFKE